MDVKTFRAKSMHEALDLVRRKLGPDASILNTREIHTRKMFGLVRGPQEIEVTASQGEAVSHRSPRNAYARAGISRASSLDQSTSSVVQTAGAFSETSTASTSTTSEDPRISVLAELIEAGLSKASARKLIDEAMRDASSNELSDPDLIRRRIEKRVDSQMPIGGPLKVEPGSRLTVALVGPTGVGKTTTIAKLAAHYRLREKRSVGLITVDTYRIAAVEQLRTYAQIIDLPMKVVSTPHEMREAAAELDSVELLLIDTAGRSPHDEIKILELKTLLQAIEIDETHLVLSAATDVRTLKTTTECFHSAGTNGLILTKLDEASELGPLYPVIRDAGLPVRYLTNGQNVPNDIEAAQAGNLARVLLTPKR